ncbi:hypothetical protein ACFQ0B_17240 [Nonomuraea thailandensis]
MTDALAALHETGERQMACRDVVRSAMVLELDQCLLGQPPRARMVAVGQVDVGFAVRDLCRQQAVPEIAGRAACFCQAASCLLQQAEAALGLAQPMQGLGDSAGVLGGFADGERLVLAVQRDAPSAGGFGDEGGVLQQAGVERLVPEMGRTGRDFL